MARERERKREEERGSTVSDYCWHCEVQTWGRRRETNGCGAEVYKNSGTRAGTTDKVEEIGKAAQGRDRSRRQGGGGGGEAEEEEVIRNTVRESTIPHPVRGKRVRMRRWIHPSSYLSLPLFVPSFRLPPVSQTPVGGVGFRRMSAESRWRETTSPTREKERENRLYLGTFFICRDLFYDTHARVNGATGPHTGERCPPRYRVLGRVEKCDTL